MLRFCACVQVIACLLLSSVASVSGAVTYRVTNLGTLGVSYNYSTALGINNNGQIVGDSYDSAGHSHAFLYNNGAMQGAMQDIGTLGGTGVYAMAINDDGHIVGYSNISGNGSYHAFLYNSETMQDLGTLPGLSNSIAYAINKSGLVVGASGNNGGNGPGHGFFYSGGTMQDLGALPGFSNDGASAINNYGQVAGQAFNPGTDVAHAFLCSNGVMRDLGTLGADCNVFGMNDAGQVVGWSENINAGNNYHAFLCDNGVMKDIGTLGGNTSCACDINDSGQVVGWSNTSSTPHAFLYANGTMIDLNTLVSGSGWTFRQANAINENGQIVGYGIDPSWHQRAFLLTPIPEPSALALLGVGAISLLACAWRRRMAS